MRFSDDIRLRAAIGIVFLLLVMLPVLYIGAGLREVNEETLAQRLKLAEQEVRIEAAAFQSDLIARQRIEKLVKHAERVTGLAAAAGNRPRFVAGIDPQVFSDQTLPDLLAAYRRLAGVEPLYIVVYGADVSNIWTWYSQDAADIQPEDRERIGWLLSSVSAEQPVFDRVNAGNPDAEDNYYRLRELAIGRSPGLTQAYYEVMRRVFSDMVYPLPYQGACYETATSKRGSRKLFSYYRALSEGAKVYGGYHVTFASRQFSAQKLLKDALANSSPGFTRCYLVRTPENSGRIVARGNHLETRVLVPAELAGYNALLAHPASLPAGLKISCDLSGSYAEAATFRRSLQAAQQVVTLVGLTVAFYFMLFGFPALLRLRLRMLLTVSMAVLMPCTILGPLALRLLDRIESLGGFELRAEAESLMFRLHSYYNDQRQQHLLQTLKIKNRLSKIVDLPGPEIEKLHAHELVRPGTEVDTAFFRNDGFGRSFRARHPESRSIANLERLLSVKFLDNLGVLDRDAPEIRKLQEMTAVADGLLDTVRQEYFDYGVLQHEANETFDLNKVDDFSRMIWFLIPGGVNGSGTIRALASTNVSNLNYLIYNPWEFDQSIFQSAGQRSQHSFLMGHRRHDDMILRWWPDQVSPDSELKRLLDEVVRKRSNTGQLTGSNGFYRFENQRFNVRDAVVFSGISTSSPDLMLGLLVKVFPFLLLIFALMSLMLFADALEALFINPVKGISQGAAEVAVGNYSSRIEIEKTDEFSLLVESFNQMTAGLAQREKMRRFVSDNLYSRLEGRKGLSELRAARKSRVTMLAADIRSFTSLSEQYDPHQIVNLLNDYFTAMETAIKANGGVIERFVGDAVMAVFYGGGEMSAEVCAASAAVAMRRQLSDLNAVRKEAGLFTIDNGVGIASGEAVSGLAGSEGGRMVFAVLGRVTRMAEILESQTRYVDSKILVCPVTAAAIEGRFATRRAENISVVVACELINARTGGEHG